MDSREPRYTGEELGNILYGIIATELGMDEEAILRVGGAAASATTGDFVDLGKAAICLATGIGCDDEEDQANILKGMNYYYTGEW